MKDKKEYLRNYYKNNKEELLKKKVYCDVCDKHISYFNMSNHRKTEVHKKKSNNKVNEEV